MNCIEFPKLNKRQLFVLKLTIAITLAFFICLSLIENKGAVLALVGEHYEDSLPIYSVETDRKIVALTFDAAWGDEDLDDILGILKEHGVKATFFVTGDWASRYPDAIKKINNYGHDLGNHGANHKQMSSLGREDILQEIEGCHSIVKTLTGIDMELFRAPYGDYNESVILAAKAKNYYTIQWDVDSLDWKDYGRESIIKKVCENKNLQNGSIILLHNGAKYTAEALDELLVRMETMGYDFVPVSELIYKQGYTIDHTGRQLQH